MNVSCAYYGGVGVATGLDGTCHGILRGGSLAHGLHCWVPPLGLFSNLRTQTA
jgi:hypothetical protein